MGKYDQLICDLNVSFPQINFLKYLRSPIGQDNQHSNLLLCLLRRSQIWILRKENWLGQGRRSRTALTVPHPEGNTSVICGTKVYTFMWFDCLDVEIYNVPSAAEMELLCSFCQVVFHLNYIHQTEKCNKNIHI